MTRKSLMTGGSRGLGRNDALHPAKAGVGVVLTCHSNRVAAVAVAVEIRAMGGTAVALPLDMRDSKDFLAFAGR